MVTKQDKKYNHFALLDAILKLELRVKTVDLFTLEPSKTTTSIQGPGAQLISARVQYALGNQHRAWIWPCYLKKKRFTFILMASTDSGTNCERCLK